MKRSLKDFSQRKRMYGRMFILPWEIGFVLFFMIPLFQSMYFVFCDVKPGDGKFLTTWTGLANLDYIFFTGSATYTENLKSALGSFAYSIPLVVALSLIVGVVLNQKFKGRIVFRCIFFLPVIVATGVVMTLLMGDNEASKEAVTSMRGGSNGVDVTAIMEGMHLTPELTKTLVGFVNSIFDLFWDCGIQIVLFISGLQSIPEQLYEVCRVEGANKWEEFWYVTFPMLSGTTMLVIIFTAIEIFTDAANPVMRQGFLQIRNTDYGTGSAMLWAYFAIVGAILGIAILLLQKFVFSKWATE